MHYTSCELRPRVCIHLLCAYVALLAAAASLAEDYPARPIRIVTSEAGGGNDVQARLLALGLAPALGVQLVIDNRPSGVVPGDVVSKAPPNGYTLLLYNSTLWIGPLLQITPYEIERDFSPITTVAKSANVLVVSPAIAAKSVTELIAVAKASSGKLNYGSSGTGASNHLAAELFKAMAGVDIVRINYKGAGPALTALLADELQVMFPTAGAVTPYMRTGRVHVIAVTSMEPSALLPGVPTVAASGLPGYESVSTYGVFAPAKTTREIIVRLNREIVRLLERPDMKAKFFAAGVEPASGTPEQLAATMRLETARISRLIKDAGIRAE